jgi:uncharacterized protein YqjF (DUF2071 family)
MGNTVFLTAEWRKLLMVNYAIDPSHLLPYLPAQTELDLWNGNCYVSLVGFMFLNTKLKGIGFPFHRNFCEINLRFYVKYNHNGQWQRGVVFIKEFVPKPIIAFIANTFYKEHYAAVPMRHKWNHNGDSLTVHYSWKNGTWHNMEVQTSAVAVPIVSGSQEEFITEHYRGYAKAKQTLEYRVEHPKWNIFHVKNHSVNVDFESSYGKNWAFLNKCEPSSVFLAEGSAISVSSKARLTG